MNFHICEFIVNKTGITEAKKRIQQKIIHDENHNFFKSNWVNWNEVHLGPRSYRYIYG